MIDNGSHGVTEQAETAQQQPLFSPSSHLGWVSEALRGCSPQESVAVPEDDSSPAFRPSTTIRHPAGAKGSQSARRDVGQALLVRQLPLTSERIPSPSEHSSPGPAANGDRELVKALASSNIFVEFERAFSEVTGLPVALRPVDSSQLPHRGKGNEGPFCALMAQKSRSCVACLAVQQKLAQAAMGGPHTTVCPAGLSETAVPLRLGNRVIGFLQTGQVFRKQPTERQFQKIAKSLVEWGLDPDGNDLRKAYFGTRVVAWREQASVVKMLSIFAEHLMMLSNDILIQPNNAESPLVNRAKGFIRDHHSENLRLPEVAKRLNLSRYYFCKMFKEGTGLSFTDYLSRIRIERSKNLLADPNLRVGEVCYEVGFQSLTHFNRVFHRILGQSPTEYRLRIGEEKNETGSEPIPDKPDCGSFHRPS